MKTRLFKKTNSPQIANDWRGFLAEYGIKESSDNYLEQSKFEFLAEMAHNQAQFEAPIFESTTPGLFFQKPGSISAMGNPVAPTPSQTPFYNGAKTTGVNSGSGDKFPSLLPISIQAAAKTIAFDLVANINMDANVGFIPYLDYVYQGGNVDTEFVPFLFKTTKIDASTTIANGPGSPAATTFGGAWTTGQRFLIDSAAGSPIVELLDIVFVGYGRINGECVFRVIDMADTVATLKDAFAAGGVITAVNAAGVATGGTLTLTTSNNEIDLTSALENHVSGFTTEGTEAWSGNYLPEMTNGKFNMPTGMARGTGEKAQFRQMGVRMFTKFVEAKTEQIGLSATVEQIQDFNRMWNIDVISMLEQIGVNEIAQQMSKEITAKIYELAYLHNAEIGKVEGSGLTTLSLEAGGGFENTSTLQRRVVTKVAEMSNLIYHRSRWGAGEYIVTNGRVAAALADINGYTFSPFSSKSPSTGGQLYPSGEVYGMKVYVDPNLKWGDNKILIGRRGKDEEPGVKFMPYIMAETIQTITESNGSPKMFIKSRYAITEAGWHPETQYILLTVSGIEKIVGSAPAVATT
jgi:hypothetical protein